MLSNVHLAEMPAIHQRRAARDPYLPVSAAAEFLGEQLIQI